MDIRVINSDGWEKTRHIDKSIIRIGSGAGCDVMLPFSAISPMHMQLTGVPSAGSSVTLRCFAGGVRIHRGDQLIDCSLRSAYELMNHDELCLDSFRIFVDLEGDSLYRRSSKHISAALELCENHLTPQTPFTGLITLKNSGTEKPCQFSMKLEGMPEACLQNAPLPYLYPGGSDSVGFVIRHLGTLPEPGIHNLNLILSAPKDYFGEMIVFKFSVYAVPVFSNELILEDDLELLKEKSEEQRKEAEPGSPADLTPAAADADEEKERIRKELADLKARHGQWVIESGEMKDQNTRFRQENERLISRYDALKKEQEALTSLTEQQRTDNGNMQTELSHLREVGSQLTDEIEHLSAKADQLHTENETLSTANEQLAAANMELRAQLSAGTAKTAVLPPQETVSVSVPSAAETADPTEVPPVQPIEITVKRQVLSKPLIPVFGRETRNAFDETSESSEGTRQGAASGAQP